MNTKHFFLSLFLLILIIFISLLCQKIANNYTLPDFLYINDNSIADDSMIFDLAQTLFNGQIALTAVFITFFGLLIQFFQDKKKYLSIDIRILFFSDSLMGFTSSTLTIISFLLIFVSYWFLSQKMLAALLCNFIVNLLFLINLLFSYFKVTTGKEDINSLAYKIIKSDIIQAIKDENIEVERIRNEKAN